MEEYTLALALEDFIPVIFSSLGLYFVSRMVAQVDARLGRMVVLGWILITIGMKALHGIRILDLTHVLSGPYAGMMLADLGAETIKVEPPVTGEGTRRILEKDPANSLNGMGAYFITLNRNKKSVTLNLKSDKGLQIFYDLVKTADVVLSNFSVGVTERLKIDHARLSEVNPRIITCNITGFGEDGPGKDRNSLDLVAQAMGGLMSLTGQPGAPPTRAGIPIGDIGGGLMGVIGVLSALLARGQTGRGQHVDISMLDTQISLLNYIVTMYFLSGVTPRAGRERSPGPRALQHLPMFGRSYRGHGHHG
jgi:CoA:oxalate CoA-transferase